MPGSSLIFLCAAVVLFAPTPALDPPVSDLDVATLSAEAESFFQSQDWLAAVDAFGELVDRDDSVSSWWFRLGQALQNLNRGALATDAFVRSAELGDPSGAAQYRAACGLARLGRTEAALGWIEQAMESGLVIVDRLAYEPDLAALRDDPRFLTVTGLDVPPDSTRDERWQFDLDLLERRLRQMHPAPYASTGASQLAAEFVAVRAQIPEWTDDRLACELARLLALVGDGVTRLVGDEPPIVSRAPHRYPLELWFAADGVVVTGAPDALAEYVGMRVTAIDGMPVDAAVARLAPYVTAATAYERQFLLSDRVIVAAEVLHALEVTRSASSAIWSLRSEDGRSLDVPLSVIEARADRGAWHRVLPAPDDRAWALQPYPDERFAYVRWRGSMGDNGRFWNRAFRRIREALAALDTHVLVLDLRGSTGVSSRPRRLANALGAMSNVNQPQRLYVIIDRSTREDAIDVLADLEKRTWATFVGEPAGGVPGLPTSRVTVRLPGCGLTALLARATRGAVPNEGTTWARDAFVPDVVVEADVADWRAGRDVALEAVKALIREARDDRV